MPLSPLILICHVKRFSVTLETKVKLVHRDNVPFIVSHLGFKNNNIINWGSTALPNVSFKVVILNVFCAGHL